MSIIQMPDSQNLLGRILGLGTLSKFTCRGFFLSRPFRTHAAVDDQADQDTLRAALADGRLIDVTDQSNGFASERLGGSFSKPTEEDTGLRVFYWRNEQGQMCVVIPKDKEDQAALDKELAETGKINRQLEAPVSMTSYEKPIEDNSTTAGAHPDYLPKIIITDCD